MFGDIPSQVDVGRGLCRDFPGTIEVTKVAAKSRKAQAWATISFRCFFLLREGVSLSPYLLEDKF